MAKNQRVTERLMLQEDADRFMGRRARTTRSTRPCGWRR